MRLGLFPRVGAPSYSYHPVHFLGLGTTSCSLPGFDPRTVQPVVSRHTDCSIRPTKSLIVHYKRIASLRNCKDHHPYFCVYLHTGISLLQY